MQNIFSWYKSTSIHFPCNLVDIRSNTTKQGDQVRQNSYPIGYGEIKGYGVPVTDYRG